MIVMLDIDGVLIPEDAPGIDPRCAARVDRIVAATGAAIVLSSARRAWGTLEQLGAWLAEGGLRTPLHDRLPLSGRPVGELVLAWMDAHPGHWPVLCLDDCPRLVGLSPAREHLVVDPVTGLTEDDVTEAIRRLRREA